MGNVITSQKATSWDYTRENGGALQVALLLTVTSLVTYQVLLHPLRTYPGPWLAKFTDAYNGLHTSRRRLHLRTWLNHLRYGPIVRQGPNKLVFSTVTAVRDIYRTDNTTKPKAYMALGPGLTTYNVFTATDNSLHRQRRQLIGQILTDTSIRTFEPIMTHQVDILVSNVLRATQSGTARRFRLGLVAVKTFRQLREPYFALMQKMIQSRMAEKPDAKHDLFSKLAPVLKADGDSGGLRDSELWAEANLFLTAAGDTVKTLISAVFFYLARNGTVYEKLATEIRTSFETAAEITSVALGKCKYLRACIDEALRMSPPAPGILWREQSDSDQPLIIDGHVIPKGTIVGVNVYSLHHNEDYFPEPFEYRPERWLGDQSPDMKRAMRDAFMPFSTGPRGCAGKTMAYAETGLVVAKILWYFDFQTCAGVKGTIGEGNLGLGPGRERQHEFQIYDVFSSMHEGPYLTFTTRGDHWAQRGVQVRGDA
ncbi:cytochrome P450 [Astrocystis sublimbata]|nr:cytochrome P450 [Astrocystis sublimbata]KAI0203438.1 cytochrome P450 [Astrocystis sublimbata]